MDHLLTRADRHILRDANKVPTVKDNSQREVPQYVDALIRELARTYSQNQIARILNQQSILRPNGLPWKQFHLSLYFKEHGIVGVGKWRGTYNL